MKTILGLFLFFLGISAVYLSTSDVSQIRKHQALSKADSLRSTLLNAPALIPHGDSGYIIKESGVRLMVLNGLNDTNGLDYWDLVSAHDTIGKYYKDVTGDYISCMLDFTTKFETHIVMQIDPKGQLKQSERFYHGNYSCCWPNSYDGFRRIGRYYAISTCGTGSGYCGEYLYLFERLIPQDSMNSILLKSFNSFAGSEYTISGDVDPHDGMLIIGYIYEVKAVIPENKQNEMTKHFDMKYHRIRGYWISPDSAKLENLQIF